LEKSTKTCMKSFVDLENTKKKKHRLLNVALKEYNTSNENESISL